MHLSQSLYVQEQEQIRAEHWWEVEVEAEAGVAATSATTPMMTLDPPPPSPQLLLVLLLLQLLRVNLLFPLLLMYSERWRARRRSWGCPFPLCASCRDYQ